MRRAGVLQGTLLIGVVLLPEACVVARDAVVTDADATFDARLLGAWALVGGSDRAVVARGPGDSYVIEYSSEGRTGRLHARLGRLGDRLILDAWPVPRSKELPAPYEAMLLAAHVPMVLEVGTGEVSVRLPSPDSLRAAMRGDPSRWPHEISADRVVLRGTTAELRRALGPYLAARGTAGERSVFRRVAD